MSDEDESEASSAAAAVAVADAEMVEAADTDTSTDGDADDDDDDGGSTSTANTSSKSAADGDSSSGDDEDDVSEGDDEDDEDEEEGEGGSGTGTGSDEDDDDDEDAMEVEATAASVGSSDGEGAEQDDVEEEGHEVSDAPLAKKPKMRIKLRLKMSSFMAGSNGGSSAAAEAVASDGGGKDDDDDDGKSTPAVSKQAEEEEDDEEEEEEAAAEAMVVDPSDDNQDDDGAAVELVEEPPAKAQKIKELKSAKQSTPTDDDSNAEEKKKSVGGEQAAAIAKGKEIKTKEPPPSASAASATAAAASDDKQVKGHPLHKPAAERAPPPSLSRPAALNPQLSYTTTGGQGGGYHTRAVRLPPVLSPGLLAAPSSAHNNVGIEVCNTEAYRMVHNQTAQTQCGKEMTTTTTMEKEKEPAGAKSKSKSNSTATTTAAAAAANTGNSDPYRHYHTPSSVFEHHMAAAGYTEEVRTQNPHRGSSIRRRVGDMFDLDVISSAHFPKMIPDYMRGTTSSGSGASDGGAEKDKEMKADNAQESKGNTEATKKVGEGNGTAAETKKVDLLGMLKSTLTSTLNKRKHETSSQEAAESTKRFRPLQFQDMVPISLTYPYPPEYMQARVEYAQKVKEREEAIAKDQAAAESAREIMETYNIERNRWQNRLEVWERARAERRAAAVAAPASTTTEGEKDNEGDMDTSMGKPKEEGESEKTESPPPPEEPVLPPLPAPVPIPPIPSSPSPPEWEDKAVEGDGCTNKVKRPSAETLGHYAANLRHLDPSTYLASVPTPTARYVGLLSNQYADALFVGPAAPGIAGIGLGLGSGLSSAYAGASGGQGGGGLHSSSYYEGLKSMLEESGSGATAGGGKRGNDSEESNIAANGDGSRKSKKKKKKKSTNGGSFAPVLERTPAPPVVVGSTSNLNKLMENGGEEAENMRLAILKATIRAARKGKKVNISFVGSDGKTYKDVGRAFSKFGRIKPCPRCRNNKQGGYHCRVRRKHKEEDYDGGDSCSVLNPFFHAPLESLRYPYRPITTDSTS